MRRVAGRKGSFVISDPIISCPERSNTQFVHLDEISTIDQIPLMCPYCTIKKDCIIEGHRGIGTVPGENTLPNFAKAIELGLDSIELDVWLSKDNELIVAHDLVAGEDESARPNEFDCAELLAKGIPTLRSVLELCKDKIFVNIELKERRIEVKSEVTKLVQEIDVMDQVAYSTFGHEVFDDTPYPTEYGFLWYVGTPFELNLELSDTINLQFELVNREMIKKIHDAGCRGFVYTSRAAPEFQYGYGETEEYYKYLYAVGIDIICTNFPEKALEFRNTHLP